MTTGNTYTRLDTQNLIELGRHAPGKDQREAQMILNHKAAIEMLVDNVDQVGFDRYTIRTMNAASRGVMPPGGLSARQRGRALVAA